MKTHDYTKRGWGHDFAIQKVVDGGQILHIAGWGDYQRDRIEEGDYLILPNDGQSTRYRVETIRYAVDPCDQWFAKLSFAPRPVELG
jgi:hypothetical protein